MQVELPSAYDIATRGTLPAPYGRASISTLSRPNRTRNSYTTTTRKGSPGASRGSPRANQKRAASGAVKTPSPLGDEEQQGARSSLQPTARSSSSTTLQSGAVGHCYQKTRHNSNSSSKSHSCQQQQQG